MKSKPISREQLQRRLRTALIGELQKINPPDDGRHLGRLARALVYEAIDVLKIAGIPDGAIAHLVVAAARKKLRVGSSQPPAGPFGATPEGKA